ncbi:MAG: hypothetical protein ACXWC6_03075 [Ramlibacter sp.]
MDSPDPTKRDAPAAEADVLGGDARNSGTMEGLRPQERRPAGRDSGEPVAEDVARPGEDENQAAFLKDSDGQSRS